MTNTTEISLNIMKDFKQTEIEVMENIPKLPSDFHFRVICHCRKLDNQNIDLKDIKKAANNFNLLSDPNWLVEIWFSSNLSDIAIRQGCMFLLLNKNQENKIHEEINRTVFENINHLYFASGVSLEQAWTEIICNTFSEKSLCDYNCAECVYFGIENYYDDEDD